MLHLIYLDCSHVCKLVFNGSTLYISRGKKKTKEQLLSSKERFVLNYLAKNSSPESPKTARDIEAAYRSEFGKEFGLYSLKNTIAAVRKKYKTLIDSSNESCSKEFITNVFKKGYYTSFDGVSNESEYTVITPDINRDKPALADVLGGYLQLHGKSLCQRGLVALMLSVMFVGSLYALNISYLNSALDMSVSRTKAIMSDILDSRCEVEPSIQRINQSINLDSAVVVAPEYACVIDKDEVRQLTDQTEIDELLSHPQFIYGRFAGEDGDYAYARVPKSVTEIKFGNLLVRYLLDVIVLKSDSGYIFTSGSVQDSIEVYSNEIGGGIEVQYYSDDILVEWLIVLMAAFLLLSIRSLIPLVQFLGYWRRLYVKLEAIVDASTNHVVYYELLTRVNALETKEYIEFIRRHNLVTLHSVMLIKQIARTRQEDDSHHYGINLCPSSLTKSDYPYLLKSLQKLGDQSLTIEIVEYSSIELSQEMLDNLSQLRALGFTVALDDFGTGSSNLELIRKVKPHYVKLGKEFLDGIETCDDVKGFLMNIATISKSSNVKVIQEGVARVGQKRIIDKIGFHYQQGYLYSDE
ncbi:EAL domain-containing protein [Vibrio paucivorans]